MVALLDNLSNFENRTKVVMSDGWFISLFLNLLFTSSRNDKPVLFNPLAYRFGFVTFQSWLKHFNKYHASSMAGYIVVLGLGDWANSIDSVIRASMF